MDVLVPQFTIGVVAGVVAAVLIELVLVIHRWRDKKQRRRYAMGAVRTLVEDFMKELVSIHRQEPQLKSKYAEIGFVYDEGQRLNKTFVHQLDVLERFVDAYRNQWTPYEQFEMLHTCTEYRRNALQVSTSGILDTASSIDYYLGKWQIIGWDWIRKAKNNTSPIPQQADNNRRRWLRENILSKTQSAEEMALVNTALQDYPWAPPEGFEESHEGFERFVRTILEDHRNGNGYRYGPRSDA